MFFFQPAHRHLEVASPHHRGAPSPPGQEIYHTPPHTPPTPQHYHHPHHHSRYPPNDLNATDGSYISNGLHANNGYNVTNNFAHHQQQQHPQQSTNASSNMGINTNNLPQGNNISITYSAPTPQSNEFYEVNDLYAQFAHNDRPLTTTRYPPNNCSPSISATNTLNKSPNNCSPSISAINTLNKDTRNANNQYHYHTLNTPGHTWAQATTQQNSHRYSWSS